MKSKLSLILLAAGLFASAAYAVTDDLPGASPNRFMRARNNSGPKLDRNALRAEVDETQALLDAFARESRGLDKAQTEPLFKSLRDEYRLDGYVGKARKALSQAEEVLEVQAAVKLQEKQVKAAAVSEQAAEDSKLLGLQSDLVNVVDRLRDTLRDIHTEANEDIARDFRNWIMISEGLLRVRREEAAAQALSTTAETVGVSAEAPLTYEGASPTTDVVLSATPVGAGRPAPVATVPTPTAAPTPEAPKKALR